MCADMFWHWHWQCVGCKYRLLHMMQIPVPWHCFSWLQVMSVDSTCYQSHCSEAMDSLHIIVWDFGPSAFSALNTKYCKCGIVIFIIKFLPIWFLSLSIIFMSGVCSFGISKCYTFLLYLGWTDIFLSSLADAANCTISSLLLSLPPWGCLSPGY